MAKKHSSDVSYRLPRWMLLPAAVLALTLTEGSFSSRAAAQPTNFPLTQQPERTLSVTGQGIRAIPTTLTQVNLGVAIEASTAQAAQQQAAQQSTAVIEWLRSQSVEDLETTGISLSPRYDYSNDRRSLRGYEATNTIQFKIATERAGEVIDRAVSEGATRIDGVSFVAEDAAVEAARQEALALAVQDAERQADTVLGALGLSRQSVINISIGSLNAPPPSPVEASGRLLAAEDVSSPVVGRSQNISAQVTLHIRY